MLILKTKGREKEQDIIKRRYLTEWVQAVNETGEYGKWYNDVSYNVKDVDGIIKKYMNSGEDQIH